MGKPLTLIKRRAEFMQVQLNDEKFGEMLDQKLDLKIRKRTPA